MSLMCNTKLQARCLIIFFPIKVDMRLTSEAKKPDKEYENEMHKLNTELQVALLNWKITSMKKKTKFDL